MNNLPAWESVKRAFEWDGSWRDVYVLNTSENDWNAVLEGLHCNYALSLFIDGELWTKALPTFSAILAMREHSGFTAKIDVSNITIKCHFFTEDQIEFDIDPREVQPENWPQFYDFLFYISRITKKFCRLTEENFPDHWWLDADAATGKMQIFQMTSKI